MGEFQTRVKNVFLKVSYVLELIIAVIILIDVLLGAIDLFRILWNIYVEHMSTPISYVQLENILAQAMLLVIGVELVVMLTLHTPASIVEVLVYAISRKLLFTPKDKGMIEVLLGVIAIAGLFATKKYILDSKKTNNNKNREISEGKDAL